jgi:transposase
MSQRKELTDFQKGEIEALRPYFSHGEISKQLNIPRRTVSSFIQRTQQRQSIENLPHPGRPRKISNTDIRYLVHVAESEIRIPFKELPRETNIDISIRTIHRRLREEGICKWRAVNRALLTEKHAAQHLA